MALEDYRERAQHWATQLSKLFAWWLVIEFGLVSLVLGIVVSTWPTSPEFLANSTGIWLLLLAGCRGFAGLALPWGWAGRLAVVEALLCGGAGFVVLHAHWPARAGATALALTFAAAVAAMGALLDGVLARFGARDRAQPLAMRALGWLVAALILMALMNVSERAALASAAVLIGIVEIALSVWLLSPAFRRDRPTPEPIGPRPVDDPSGTNVGLALLAPTDPPTARRVEEPPTVRLPLFAPPTADHKGHAFS